MAVEVGVGVAVDVTPDAVGEEGVDVELFEFKPWSKQRAGRSLAENCASKPIALHRLVLYLKYPFENDQNDQVTP